MGGPIAPVSSVSWKRFAPIPKPKPSCATLPTKRSSGSSFLLITRLYIEPARSLYTSLPSLNSCNSSVSSANQAKTRASIADKSATKIRCSLGAVSAKRSGELRGMFCMLSFSVPPKRPVCAA